MDEANETVPRWEFLMQTFQNRVEPDDRRGGGRRTEGVFSLQVQKKRPGGR